MSQEWEELSDATVTNELKPFHDAAGIALIKRHLRMLGNDDDERFECRNCGRLFSVIEVQTVVDPRILLEHVPPSMSTLVEGIGASQRFKFQCSLEVIADFEVQTAGEYSLRDDAGRLGRGVGGCVRLDPAGLGRRRRNT